MVSLLLSKRGFVTPLDLLAMLLVVQPWLLLAAVAAVAHRWPKPSSAPVVSQQGTPPSRAQDVAFVLVEFQEMPAGPFLHPVQVPPDSRPAIPCTG